ncbi:hypothetical protein D3C83_66210 [compost metagenome]
MRSSAKFASTLEFESCTKAPFHCFAAVDFFVIAVIRSSFSLRRRLLTARNVSFAPCGVSPFTSGATLPWMKPSEIASVLLRYFTPFSS